MPAPPICPQSRLDRLAGQLGVAIVLASILGGLSFLLRHIGLIDPAGYAADLARFCHPPLQTLWLPASCRAWSWLDGAGGAITRLDMGRLYQISPPELLLKLLRHGLMAGLVPISGLVVWRHPGLRLPPRQLLLWLPLQLSLGVALWIGLQRGPIPAVLAGLPGQLWVPLVPLCGWLLPRRRLQRLVDAVAVLLLLHLPVLVLEAMRGLPLRHATRLWGVPLPGRLPGLMGQPNTLGVVVVLGLAFCLAFSARAWHRPVLVAAALPQLLLARSGMGLLALALLLLLPSLQRQWQRHPRRALLLAPGSGGRSAARPAPAAGTAGSAGVDQRPLGPGGFRRALGHPLAAAAGQRPRQWGRGGVALAGGEQRPAAPVLPPDTGPRGGGGPCVTAHRFVLSAPVHRGRPAGAGGPAGADRHGPAKGSGQPALSAAGHAVRADSQPGRGVPPRPAAGGEPVPCPGAGPWLIPAQATLAGPWPGAWPP